VASSGTALRVSNSVTSRGREGPAETPQRKARSVVIGGDDACWQIYTVKRLVDVTKSDQGSLAMSINNFGDACLVIRGRR
jgi:hypothetical protein